MSPDEFAEFDEVLKLAKSHAAPQALDAAVARATQELQNRRYVYGFVHGRTRGTPTYNFTNEPPRPVGLVSLGRRVLLCLGLILALVIGVAFGKYFGIGFALTVVIGTAAWQFASDQARRRKSRLEVCLSCEYSLRGLPREAELSNLISEDWGPARCPECGRSWPRIPLRGGSPTSD